MPKLDGIDRRILSELETDGRMSYAELGNLAGLSKSPCWKRVQQLEEEGVITGYRAMIDPAKVGFEVQCIIEIAIRNDAHIEFEEAIANNPRIIECYTIAGSSDYMIRVLARSVGDVDDLLRYQISKLPGVQSTSTKICLKQIKSGGRISQAL